MSKSEFNDAENSRRSFLKRSVLATATFATADFGLFAAPPLAGNTKPEAINQESLKQEDAPWFRRVTRWGQKPESGK